MTVIIWVDPHKQSHTGVAICGEEREVARVTVRATCQQTAKLLACAEPFEERIWAIESAGGLCYLLAQQLVDVGEHVVDVPPTLASRVRVLGTGRSDKNDPNDAFSVAVAALRSQGLRRVEAAEHSEILGLLAERNHDLGRMRARLICRLHNALADLSPGGIAKELYASDADRLLENYEPATPIEHMRYELARELVDDVRRLDEQIKASHRRIRTAIRASKTTLTELFGVGPIVACAVIGYTDDVRRFVNRDHFAAYAGVAPIGHSSGGRTAHRLSRRGNRKLNNAIRIAAISQIRQPHSDGRAYFDRKVAECKTKREAVRSLKRHISNALYRQLVIEPKVVREDTRKRLIACVVGSAS
jgi:transposase